MKILIDVDGILAHFTHLYLERLNGLTGRNHVDEDITSFNFADCVASKEEDAAVWASFRQGDVKYLPTYPHAATNLRKLRALGEVIAVTAPAYSHPYWVSERFEWLTYLGFDKNSVIFTHVKHAVIGSCLIDDSIDNIQKWCQTGRLGYLLTRPWNAGHTVTGATRVSSLQEVVDLIQNMG